MRRYIGIDPGLTGGIAALDVQGDHVEIVCATGTPTLVGVKRRKPSTEYDVRAMHQILAALVVSRPEGGCVVVLEHAQTRKEQHAGSVLQTGKGWGLWRGIIGSLDVEVQHLAPAVWKKRQNLLHTPKQASVLRAKDKFPALARLKRTEHGIADAALIAATAAEC